MGFLTNTVMLAASTCGENGTCADSDGIASATTTLTDGLSALPVERWSGAVGSLESRVDTDGLFGGITSWFGSIPSNLTGAILNLGNSIWSAAASLQSWASGTSILDKVGPMANEIMGAIYEGLSSNWMIFTLPAIVAIVLGMWSVVRGRGAAELAKRCTALTVGIGIFVTMGATSAANPESAAVGTPWWMVQTSQSILNEAGGGIADSVLDYTKESGTFLADANADDYLSCQRYLAELDTKYSDGLEEYSMENPILTSLNTMWEETGLRIWITTQYGDGDDGLQSFCRVLEARAGASAQDMFEITNDAADGTLKSKFGENSYRGIAWWPNLLVTSSIETDDDEGESQNGFNYDRLATIFDVCGFNGSTFQVRDGWHWVNSIEGDERGVTQGTVNDNDDDDDTSNLQQECRIALTGYGNSGGYYYVTRAGDGDVDWDDVDGDLSDDDVSTGDIVNVDFVNNVLYRIALKFDISTDSGWETTAYSNEADTDITEVTEAVNTVKAQHGNLNTGDIGGAVVALIAAIVNFVIWGLILGIMKLACTVMSVFCAVGGIGIGALILAFAPERGQKALTNAFTKMFGMMAGVTVVSIVAAIGVLFVNTGLGIFNLIDDDGNTTGSTLLIALASALLPVGYILIVRWLCRDVWRIGDPFGKQGFMSIMGGNAVGGALKAVGGAVAGGGAALLSGAGIGGALQAAAGALGSPNQSVMGAMSRGMAIGRQAQHMRGMENAAAGGGLRDTRRRSGADAAAAMPEGSTPGGDGSLPKNQPGGGAVASEADGAVVDSVVADGAGEAAVAEQPESVGARVRAAYAASRDTVGGNTIAGRAADAVAEKKKAFRESLNWDTATRLARSADHGMRSGLSAANMAGSPVSGADLKATTEALDSTSPFLAERAVNRLHSFADKAGQFNAQYDVTGRIARGARTAANVAGQAGRVVGDAANVTGRFLSEHPLAASGVATAAGVAGTVLTGGLAPAVMAGGTIAASGLAHTTLNPNGLVNRAYNSVSNTISETMQSSEMLQLKSDASELAASVASPVASAAGSMMNTADAFAAERGWLGDGARQARAQAREERVYESILNADPTHQSEYQNRLDGIILNSDDMSRYTEATYGAARGASMVNDALMGRESGDALMNPENGAESITAYMDAHASGMTGTDTSGLDAHQARQVANEAMLDGMEQQYAQQQAERKPDSQTPNPGGGDAF